MKIRMLMAAVSVAALMSMPAVADTVKSSENVNSRTETASPGRADGAPMTKAEAQKDWQETKADVKEAVANFKATVLNDNVKEPQEPITIETRMTAEGIIGQPVYNQANDKIAVVKDIILDKSGSARLIVLKDGDFMGLGGKLAAFDYDMVIDQTKDGDVIMPITEKSLEKVAEFSYDNDDKGDEKTRVIPKDGFSVNKLLDGEIVGSTGKKLAHIDNVSFRGGKANMVFATHSQLLHMGGDKVAINFDAARLTQDKDHDNVNLKLSAAETRQFENFKKSAAK
jgi:sporulation protein YlmC with PRC-barrel domain